MLATSGMSGPVTDRTILGVSPAWAAIRYISEGVASMPFGVYSYVPSMDSIEEKDAHPLQTLLSARPHPYYSKFDFLQAIVANACLGNGYALIHRDQTTYLPYALELIPPYSVCEEYNRFNELQYRVSWVNGNESFSRIVPYMDMIHIKGLTMNGLQGEKLSLIHNENFAAAASSQTYARAFYENGAAISGLLSTDQELKDSQRKNAYNAWNGPSSTFGGASNAGKTAIVDGGLKYQRIGATPVEASAIDFRNLNVEEASRIFKVPIHMLSALGNATFSNIEQQSLEFRQYTLPTWTEKIEQEFSFKLFKTSEFKSRRAFAMFDYTYIQQGDMVSLSNFLASGIQNGYLKPNDARRMLKKSKVEDGDRLFIQMNLAPLDKIDEIQAPQETQTPAATDPAADTATDTSNNPTDGTPNAGK